ncbi:MAG: LptF/LptG family permease [Myxococcota bacterium]
MRASRYIFSHLWPPTLFVILVGWLLFSLLDGMETARWLAHGTFPQVIFFYLLRAPDVMMELMNPGLVLGTLAGLGALNRRAEMAALSASGRSLATTALPAVLALGVMLAGARVVLSELVRPVTSMEALEMSTNIFRLFGPRYYAFYGRSEWVRAGPIYARAQPQDDNVFAHVTGAVIDENLQIKERLVARRISALDEHTFVLEDAVINKLDPPRMERVRKRRMEWPSAAAALSVPMGYPEMYDVAGLERAIRHREAGGRDASPYRVALVRRFVDPVMLVFLGALAVALAARQRREAAVERLLFVGGVAVAAAQGVVMACDELAGRALLPLWVGGMGAPLAVAVAAVLFWRRVEQSKAMR